MKSAIVKVSSKGQIVIPKEVRDDLHWGSGVELILVITEQGVMLRTKTQVEKQPVKSLRGFLKYSGETISTEQLCKPVENSNDRF